MKITKLNFINILWLNLCVQIIGIIFILYVDIFKEIKIIPKPIYHYENKIYIKKHFINNNYHKHNVINTNITYNKNIFSNPIYYNNLITNITNISNITFIIQNKNFLKLGLQNNTNIFKNKNISENKNISLGEKSILNYNNEKLNFEKYKSYIIIFLLFIINII